MNKILMLGGSRGYSGELKIKNYIDKLSPYTVIVHGGCPNSPDVIASEYARSLGFVVGIFPYVSVAGKEGGHGRNRVMVDMADHCVFFWDGKSSGTGKTIEYAKSLKKSHEVIL